MACTIDHLTADQRVNVLRDFTDAQGVRHRAGESAVIRRMEYHPLKQQIVLIWERDGKTESLPFDLRCKTGPGNGRMREYFEVVGLEPEIDPERRFVPGIGPVTTVPPEPPPLGPPDSDHPGAVIAHICALAAHRRFREAEEQLSAARSVPDQALAEALGGLAERYAFTSETEIYEWLREHAIHCWYAWGSQATSGGEGTARLREMEPALERLKKLDAARADVARKT